MKNHHVTIEYVDLDMLKPSLANPKDHDVGLICQSIERFGFKGVIEYDERKECIHSGHGRRKALMALRKLNPQAPPSGIKYRKRDGAWMVPILRGYATRSETEFKALRIADNQTTVLGGWDNDALISDLTELAELDCLDGVGFDGDDLDRMLAISGDPTTNSDADVCPTCNRKRG